MATKVKIDPFTRIEGHLAIDLEIEEGNVTEARCKGEMFRGFEQILKGRSPLDAQQITQRICGVCPVSHGLASVACQEKAYGITPPENGRLIRNIMLAGNYIQSHITHFYHLSALDFVDVPAVLRYDGQDRFLKGIRKWVEAELASGKLFPAAPFLPRYEGRYLGEMEGNIGALKHYFKALKMRATAHQLVAIFAGKMPHMATIVPGGVTEKVTSKKIALCRTKLAELKDFFENSYRPDVLAVARAFTDYIHIGRGCGNYLAYGAFSDRANGPQIFPAGAVINGTFSNLSTSAISEKVRYSKYSENSGFGRTQPRPDKSGAYSWLKAPRYNNMPMEVGPLARLMVAVQSGKAPEATQAVHGFLESTGLSPEHLDSCLGRHAARIIETEILIDHCEKWIEQLDPATPTCIDFDLPAMAKGEGLVEAPRGALGHWIEIRDHKIHSYECIVPTTWNCSPKDDTDTMGPVEQSLINTPIADRANPIEAARVVRSYDPCLACAVH